MNELSFTTKLLMAAHSNPTLGDLQQRIAAAALHLFAERGVDATPMPMIAEHGGVAVGSLYRYYANKEELVARLYAENYRRLAEQLDRVQAAERSTHDKIAAMVRFVCGFFDREWDLARFLLLEQHLRLKNYDGPVNPVEIVRRVLGDGMRRGELRAVDVTVATALVMGPVIQAATFRTYGRLTGALSDLADEIVRGIWAAIARQGG
jgi:AcrR family transcriptional regulator